MKNEKVLEYVEKIRNNNSGMDGLNQILEQMTDDVFAENIVAEQKKSGNSKVAAALKELLKSGEWAIKTVDNGCTIYGGVYFVVKRPTIPFNVNALKTGKLDGNIYSLYDRILSEAQRNSGEQFVFNSADAARLLTEGRAEKVRISKGYYRYAGVDVGLTYVNKIYLGDMINACGGDVTVTIHESNPSKPIYVKGKNAEGILMPIKKM